MGSGKTTSFDIAHRAGVSQATVSRALRNSPLVNPETRERVQRIAREMNYRVDRSAAGLWLGLGLDSSRDSIRRADTALVVEGYMDLISLAQSGINNAANNSPLEIRNRFMLRRVRTVTTNHSFGQCWIRLSA